MVITKYEIRCYTCTATVRAAEILEEKFQSAGLEVESGNVIYLTTTHTVTEISKALEGIYSPKYIIPVEEVIL